MFIVSYNHSYFKKNYDELLVIGEGIINFHITLTPFWDTQTLYYCTSVIPATH